jgi:hypothetical protein
VLLPLERRLPTSADLSADEAAALDFMTELPDID